MSFLVPPGTYTVKLSAGGQELTTPLVVLKDPNSGGSEAGIRAQTELLKEIAARVNESVDMVNRLETVRAQLASLRSTLRSDSSRQDVRRAADSLDAKLIGVEGELTQLLETGRGQDGVRYPTRLISQLMYLASGISDGEFAPTDQQREVYQMLSGKIRDQRAAFDRLMAQDLEAFNAMLRQKNLAGVIVTAP